jgi:hypothetical protein
MRPGVRTQESPDRDLLFSLRHCAKRALLGGFVVTKSVAGDGRVVEYRIYWDGLALARQLADGLRRSADYRDVARPAGNSVTSDPVGRGVVAAALIRER